MRRYTLVFMEQRIGVPRLTPIEGEDGAASFTASDDETALAHINGQLLGRLKACVRGELSSLRIQSDRHAPGGMRLMDDSHVNPHFQDYYVKYDPSRDAAELDFDSTRTALFSARSAVAG